MEVKKPSELSLPTLLGPRDFSCHLLWNKAIHAAVAAGHNRRGSSVSATLQVIPRDNRFEIVRLMPQIEQLTLLQRLNLYKDFNWSWFENPAEKWLLQLQSLQRLEVDNARIDHWVLGALLIMRLAEIPSLQSLTIPSVRGSYIPVHSLSLPVEQTIDIPAYTLEFWGPIWHEADHIQWHAHKRMAIMYSSEWNLLDRILNFACSSSLL